MKCKICGSRTVAENSVDELCVDCENKYNLDEWDEYEPIEKIYPKSVHKKERER